MFLLNLMNPMAWFLLLVCVILLYCVIQEYRRKKEYLLNWAKWENEYWMLRKSDAVDTENYDIHISWLPRGNENCIVFKNNEGNT